MFEQKFAFSLVVFCSHAAIWFWFLLFFQLFGFFGSDFFLNGFPNPFIVHSMPSFFVWTKFSFLAGDFFCSHAVFWHWFSVFLKKNFWFFQKWIFHSFIGRIRSSLRYSLWKLFELYVWTCPVMFFRFCSGNLKWFKIVSQLIWYQKSVDKCCLAETAKW